MTNLLHETLQCMETYGLGPMDVEWVGSVEYGAFGWREFAFIAADTEYGAGYGFSEIAHDLTIVGADWWMTRDEYDGSEWWIFHRKPNKPADAPGSFPRTIVTPQNEWGSEQSLKEMNP